MEKKIKSIHYEHCSDCDAQDEFYEGFIGKPKGTTSSCGLITFKKNKAAQRSNESEEDDEESSKNAQQSTKPNICVQTLLNEWKIKNAIPKHKRVKMAFMNQKDELLERHLKGKFWPLSYYSPQEYPSPYIFTKSASYGDPNMLYFKKKYHGTD